MKTIRPALFLAISTAALACGGSTEPDTTPPKIPPKAKAAVEVSIASVTLADDCGHGPTQAPPADEPVQTAQAPASSERMARGASMSADISAGARACEQSSIQLRVANSTDADAKVVIQKIEILDGDGAKVGELTPRAPSRWTNDTYEAWDEQVAAGATLSVSYALSAPGVSRGETYTVRVIVAADGGAQTLERSVTLHAEASLPPGVVT
jgi:hypothetical protein